MRFYDRVADDMYQQPRMRAEQVIRMERRRFIMQRVNRRHKPREASRRPVRGFRLPMNCGPAVARR